MLSLSAYFKYLAVMALVTYLLRALPFVLVKKKITNAYIRSFLEYIPYGVLAAMTFPAVFTSAGGRIPSLAGMTVALILAFLRLPMIAVALSSAAAVYLTSLFLSL